MEASTLKKVAGVQHRTDLQPFTEDQVRFEIDMCIGCDRCMRACPIPMSSMVSIADLNRATVSDDIPQHIAQFTEECVMCGSCVPVCPVDNHRDLLMLSLKQRLGVSWDGLVELVPQLTASSDGLSIVLGRGVPADAASLNVTAYVADAPTPLPVLHAGDTTSSSEPRTAVLGNDVVPVRLAGQGRSLPQILLCRLRGGCRFDGLWLLGSLRDGCRFGTGIGGLLDGVEEPLMQVPALHEHVVDVV